MDAAAVVDAAFRDDARIRAKLSEHYSDRARAAAPIAKKAEEAFKGFRPSLFSARDRERRTYLAPGENLPAALDRIVKRGVEKMRNESERRSLKLRMTDGVKALVTEAPDGGLGTMVLTDLIGLLNLKLPAAPSLRDEPAVTACAAEKEAQRRLDGIEGNPEAEPPAGKPQGAPPPDGDHEPAVTKDFIAKHVHALMAETPAPEEEPVLAPRKRDELGVVHAAVQNLELRAGPSDVTSYHDFNGLQIAFEHVWAEVFDARLGQLGRELYETYVDLVDFTDYHVDPQKSVTSLDDIRKLMGDATQLGRLTDTATLPSSVPQQVLSAFDVARQNVINALTGLLGVTTATAVADNDLQSLRSAIQLLAASDTAGDKLAKALPSVTRLTNLLTELNDILKQRYAFTVFEKGSSNFGIMVTYRQTWEPDQYQVGDLVSTIPLAPRETRRYTTRHVTKKSRTTKEIENNLQANKTDADSTSRADREIVARAENRTNFNITADGSFGTEADKIHATAQAGGASAKFSQDTKKDFHQAVLKSAQEYKHDNRTEVETSASEETESTTYHEIQNPNDELTVTYLFYELQRTYRISEKIHQVTPVVLVANEMPGPDQIDDAWLIKHDWILRRVLLDDSFRPALDYLTKSFVGDELNLQILDSNAQAQRQVVEQIRAQVAAQLAVVDKEQRDLSQKIDAQAGLQFTEGILGTVKSVFDPFHLTGDSVTGTKEGMDTVANYAQGTLDRAEREKARLLDQLAAATSALQIAIDKLAAATREHYDKVSEVDRLRVHVKENILYYMQAIWNHEPPDQRYFRVFTTKVPVVEPKSANDKVSLASGSGLIGDIFSVEQMLLAAIPFPEVEIIWKPLVEIADLDQVLGYKGNYAIYPLKENNYLTLHMMQDYLELSDEITIRDPDDVANYTMDELQELAACLYQRDKPAYENHKDEIKQLIIDRLISGRAEDDRVVVPTKSLYIEALVGTHPLLEDFKLYHRALDVKKVQAETRHAELENVRLAARALKGKDEDPDIEKKIIIQGDGKGVVVQPDGP